jgi:hypothetical protein
MFQVGVSEGGGQFGRRHGEAIFIGGQIPECTRLRNVLAYPPLTCFQDSSGKHFDPITTSRAVAPRCSEGGGQFGRRHGEAIFIGGQIPECTRLIVSNMRATYLLPGFFRETLRSNNHFASRGTTMTLIGLRSRMYKVRSTTSLTNIPGVSWTHFRMTSFFPGSISNSDSSGKHFDPITTSRAVAPR